MNEKQWVKEMGQKFLHWRDINKYAGAISVPEVSRWTLDVLQEREQIEKEKGK